MMYLKILKHINIIHQDPSHFITLTYRKSIFSKSASDLSHSYPEFSLCRVSFVIPLGGQIGDSASYDYNSSFMLQHPVWIRLDSVLIILQLWQ